MVLDLLVVLLKFVCIFLSDIVGLTQLLIRGL